MKYHLIAVGGAVMHNLALALKQNGHTVTGSDDEIYEPARSRLKAFDLLPDTEGWHTGRISTDLDAVILGMHARKDNPELLKAQELGLPIYSFPEFIYQHSAQKTRIVVAGSHGKTTTTSMIMHVLKHAGRDFDYLVGALLEGFDTMVRLSDASVMVIEGDEYLASPLDLRPKIMHYKPHIAIITGVAWDHANVFPTFKNYVLQFDNFIKTLDTEGSLFWYKHDKELQKIASSTSCKSMPYDAFNSDIAKGKTVLKTADNRRVSLEIFGDHNLANLKAAYLACREIGVSDNEFFAAISSFKGAAKRLQILAQARTSVAFLDFAHAPSKVKATIDAMKAQYPKRELVACLELHTFSSLSKSFLPQYEGTMQAADEAVVFFNEHTLAMKKMPPLSIDEVKAFFKHPNLTVFTDNQALTAFLKERRFKNQNLLLMTSGTFVGLNLKELATELLN